MLNDQAPIKTLPSRNLGAKGIKKLTLMFTDDIVNTEIYYIFLFE